MSSDYIKDTGGYVGCALFPKTSTWQIPQILLEKHPWSFWRTVISSEYLLRIENEYMNYGGENYFLLHYPERDIEEYFPLYEILRRLFQWSCTKEGSDFWLSIHSILEEIYDSRSLLSKTPIMLSEFRVNILKHFLIHRNIEISKNPSKAVTGCDLTILEI
jgi:hypothetical protein